ncbi:MAG: NAD(P)-binding protein [Clostridiales bacterium]|jgi:prolycopene isomerase|nr:NAD(P)-binding protein [Clostridiales bacterium]
MDRYDAIVVGAGNGGLTSAAWLAKEGKKVLLVERHNLPGGFATSFKRGRFEFEASLHELCGWGRSPGEGSVRKILEQIGAADKVEMCRIPAAYRVITMNDKENIDVTMPFGINEFTDKMEELVPGSRPSVEKFFKLCSDVVKTSAFMGEIGGKFDKAAISAVLNEHMDFVRVAGYTVNEVFDALNMPQKAKDILSAYWSYLGEPLSELGFVHYASMMNTYIEGGAGGCGRIRL